MIAAAAEVGSGTKTITGINGAIGSMAPPSPAPTGPCSF
jgi:hypothetical protein